MEEKKDKLAIIVFSGELDRAIAAFILATTAASMGTEVSMFFTFWGLNIIKKKDARIPAKGMMRLFNLINRGGADRLKLSRFHMLGLGTGMIKRLMRKMNMPSVEEFIAMAHQMGVRMYACSTTCGIMGLPENAFRSEVTGIAGAAFFLNEARESKTTLFI